MTTPACSFHELRPGSAAPGFVLPSHTGGEFSLHERRSKECLLLYFGGGLFFRTNQATDNLRTLAGRLDDFSRANVRIVAISRDEFTAAAADPFLNRYGDKISVLVDRDAEVGRLYGIQCLEVPFGTNYGYDRGPLLCLIDSNGFVRLHIEVTQISANDPPRPLTAIEFESQQFSYEVRYLPGPVGLEFLVQFAEAKFGDANNSRATRSSD